ncbi:MAG TPA: hypothetical protein VN549_07660 [Negativicutes bacterium]|nr:hypothetical protein [Negativicutes bacterium]
MLVGLVGAPWILAAMGTPREVMGDSRRPLHYLIASCFVNIFRHTAGHG